MNDFNKYLDKIRDYHRRAQTAKGLLEVSEELGILEINYQPSDKFFNFFFNFDAALLEAIAKKVIPKRYKWEMSEHVEGNADIFLIGIDYE